MHRHTASNGEANEKPKQKLMGAKGHIYKVALTASYGSQINSGDRRSEQRLKSRQPTSRKDTQSSWTLKGLKIYDQKVGIWLQNV
ncbi:hypothetical protein T265_04835 [Opisthorchis viverrini]|uniref:Uncharacterized protein n=1 Tax=Opisthorchis viverrini TaxID=6198 RepID=A0A075AG21_OPIVI|nr:hypothetical protein T265_04835 [Opisthorchis viverrini]KER28304.1 hypothetical protein T265_04835 [Opisthorchis viverrini]